MKDETFISGLKLGAAGGILAPTILAYREDDFVTAFLADMGAADWQDRLEARSVFEGAVGPPELQQPVHRVFHVVVVDARCLTPGLPRLDPAKIASAGMVVRRVREGGEDGWMRRNDVPLGWKAPPAGSLFDELTTYDPKAELRRQKALGRNARLLQRLDTLPGDGGDASEAEIPLFPVPPGVMENTGLTLFFGFLPLSSSEVEPEVSTDPPFGAADVLARLPDLLGTQAGASDLPPIAEEITRADMLRPVEDADEERGKGLGTLKRTLTWLAQETGAFTDGAAPGIAATLNGITLEFDNGATPGIAATLNGVTREGTTDAQYFDFLRRCYRAFLLQGPDDPISVRMPDEWPVLTASQEETLVTHAVTAMSVRWASVASQTPQYPALALTYRLRCFLRIDDCPGCPPRIVWSRPSDDWTIRPWFNGGDGPPRQIEMPALSLNAIKALKPDITVKVPPELQQHLDRINMPDLMEGKHTKTGINFGMLCGFSIPIITICAFIILQIFLQLLNIIFFWLPYVRICIPFPKPPSPPSDP